MKKQSSVAKILNDLVDGLKKRMAQSRSEFAADSRQAKELDRKLAEVNKLTEKGAANYEEFLKLVREIGLAANTELEIPAEAQFPIEPYQRKSL